MRESCVEVDGGVLSYKFKFVSDKLIIIKVGSGGSLSGYNNKYEVLFNYFVSSGYSVLVCDNNIGISDEASFTASIELANLLSLEQNIKFNIYYLGMSKGASQFLAFGYRYSNIVKALLINPPLNINWHKQADGIKAIDNSEVAVAIGTLDPSYKFAGLIDLCKNDKVKAVICEKADHNFTGMLDEFLEVCKGLI